VTVWNAACKR